MTVLVVNGVNNYTVVFDALTLLVG